MNAEVVAKANPVAKVDAVTETKNIEVKTYPTASTVLFVYPQNSEPFGQIQEELVTVVDGDFTTEPLRTMRIDFDPTATIPMIDPTSGVDTGTTMTQGQLLAALYSLWLQQRAIAIAAENAES